MDFWNIIKKHKTGVYVFLLVIITAALYARCVTYDYVGFDDSVFFVENNESISSIKNLANVFKTPVFNMSGLVDYYRPVLMVSFMTDNLIAGNTSAVHHGFNILVHLIAVILLFVLLRRLGYDKTFSFLFSLIFAVHPAFAHIVAWIPGRNDSLLAVFVISSFLFLIDYCKSGRLGSLIAVIFLYFLAFLTKESAAAMFVIFPVFMLLFYEKPRKKAVILFACMALVSLIYFFIRGNVLASANLNLAVMVRNVLFDAKTILNFTEYFIIPAQVYLCADKLHITLLTVIACIIAVIPLAASFFFDKGNKKTVFFGFFWFVIFLLPTFAVKNEYLPHRIYLPSIGLIIAYIEVFTAVSKREILKKYLIIILLFFAAVFLFASTNQVQKFKNAATFLAYAIDESPESSMLRLKTAEYYAGLGRTREAKGELEKVNTEQGRSLEYLEILGWIYAQEGNYQQAVNIYEGIIAERPEREPSLNNLAAAYSDMGNSAKAVEVYEKLIKLHPEKAKYKIWKEELEKENTK